ncbi:hypothetical protein [Acetobacterium wieringae]|uniref:hypothetical protein n=1 Tax=Acetobacterium wieringae TaxID=52694 RepID=UPI0020336548|nr:hypothetical protein [Acetobacterium wieringae]URN85868.1 hypothetical protein CHL1_001543 [Acetobacterium wieringae]
MANEPFRTFPADKCEALTMLYLEHHGVKSSSPEELLDKYEEVYKKMKDHDRKDKPQIGAVTVNT